jgi:hypothetical protein
MSHSGRYSRIGAVILVGTVVVAFAVTAAPPTQAYQDSQLCIINNTSQTVRATFKSPRGGGSIARRDVSIAMNQEVCQQNSRPGGYDVAASLRSGDRADLGAFFVNNPAVGWPVIAARLQSNPSCSWSDWTNTCWYVRLGQRQHRCIQENGYWLRPSREADSNGAKQFRVQVYDRTADPSTFGC